MQVNETKCLRIRLNMGLPQRTYLEKKVYEMETH